jgi:hypothetical protein
MAEITRRLAAAAALPTKSSITFDNMLGPSRLVLQSADPSSRWILPLTDLQTGNTLTSFSLNAAVRNAATGQIHLSLAQADTTGMMTYLGTAIMSTSDNGIAVTDRQANLAGGDASPVVDLTQFTYVLVLSLINSAPAPDISDLVVPWVEYSYA